MKNVSVFKIELGQMVYVPARKIAGVVYMIEASNDICISTKGYTNEENRKVQVLVTPTNTLIECRMNDIEPLASDAFQLGQEVESVLGGGFSGKVTAIEKESNRVICISDKIGSYSDDRGRWAYKVTELVPAIRIEFKNLDQYIINDDVHVVITGHPNKKYLCNMMDCTTGELFAFSIDRKISPKDLKHRFGITKLVRL